MVGERSMNVYEFGPFRLDEERLLLCERGEPVPLGPKVVETLLALIEHAGEVVTKSSLLDRIWPEGYVDEANLTQNVHVLRKTLRTRWNTEPIETIPRRGYRFTAAVTRRAAVRVSDQERPQQPVASQHLWYAAAAALLAIAITAVVATAFFSGRTQASTVALSPDAERMLAIGRYYWNLRTQDGVRKSIFYFSHVIDADPRSPEGYAALASANAIMGDYMYGPARPDTYYARARAYAQKALTLDPTSGEAYAVLGMLLSEKGSSREAISQLQRAVAFDPKSGPARLWYGVALLESGRASDAYAQLRASSELDPLSVATSQWLGEAAYLQRHYTDAIAYEREALDLVPNRYEANEMLGLSYEAIGDDRHAMESFRELSRNCTQCRPEAAALLAELYGRAKHFTQARAELAIARAHETEVEPYDLAVAYAAIGERESALCWLRRLHGADYTEYLKMEFANDPRFDALRKIVSS
jgi:DNA-binding winged helix-turn-helix (wHTH) protein